MKSVLSTSFLNHCCGQFSGGIKPPPTLPAKLYKVPERIKILNVASISNLFFAICPVGRIKSNPVHFAINTLWLVVCQFAFPTQVHSLFIPPHFRGPPHLRYADKVPQRLGPLSVTLKKPRKKNYQAQHSWHAPRAAIGHSRQAKRWIGLEKLSQPAVLLTGC